MVDGAEGGQMATGLEDILEGVLSRTLIKSIPLLNGYHKEPPSQINPSYDIDNPLSTIFTRMKPISKLIQCFKNTIFLQNDTFTTPYIANSDHLSLEFRSLAIVQTVTEGGDAAALASLVSFPLLRNVLWFKFHGNKLC